ncbi:DUF1304 domain-containing protein [Secundilactobacillus silagei]|jgi:putative membrane protein|uniref:Membrane protein n=1 Tax=Secundilactobacillus silagei JCM 19001 TaxID=1302250 RepID=A0A1Z5IID0_9LACO|nr:DUF1304 domain-containing protein [Secundilactobacillus silagei]TDG73139.1 hypothetical protein C5L25_000780 [Secundilactobacillus silagei JCM 19001]GAX01456.1 membrane protein [Secundilactobacillus silagei JCM 19001]
MSLISTVLIVIVAVEALLILCLEMFGSQTAAARNAFGFSAEYQHQPETKTTMANIGLYNGFVGVGLLFMRFALPASAVISGSLLFTGFVVVAGIYGGLTVNRQIALTQGLPGLLAFLSLLIFK